MRMPMTDLYEYTAFTGCKKYHKFRPGQRKAIKRRYNRKERKWLDDLLVGKKNYEKENY